MAKSSAKKQNGNGATLGFEAQLSAAADKMSGNMEPSDYKHVARGLIFLKYISDVFYAKRAELLKEELADAEDPEECLAENVFWVPKEARSSHLQARAEQTIIGEDIDDTKVWIGVEILTPFVGCSASNIDPPSPRAHETRAFGAEARQGCWWWRRSDGPGGTIGTTARASTQSTGSWAYRAIPCARCLVARRWHSATSAVSNPSRSWARFGSGSMSCWRQTKAAAGVSA